MTAGPRPTHTPAELDGIDGADLDGSDLLDQVGAALARYVVLPSPEASTAVTLWVAASHAAPAWHTAPRLVVRAPQKRCGKSRLLDVVEALSYSPVMTVNASPSAVYRMIGTADEDPPTILIDEADTIFNADGGGNEDLRGLLNAGHQRNRPALRYDAATKSVEALETYAMAALAGIGRMPDTIEDRGVVIRMRRRAPGEHVKPFRIRRDAAALHGLRDHLHAWIRAHLDHLTDAEPDMPLEDRAADTWEPLIVVADLARGDWPDLARHAAVTLDQQKAADEDDNDGTRLLADCRKAFAGRNLIRTSELVGVLLADPEAPWATHNKTGLNPRSLGLLLREFAIHPHKVRTGGDQFRGYAAADFADAWNRYLPTDQGDPPEEPSQPSR